jgi:hypothetical protein
VLHAGVLDAVAHWFATLASAMPTETGPMPFTLDDKYLRSTEEKLGATLPDSYRRAMMTANGGEVATGVDDWYLYPIMDGTDKKRLARTCNDVVAETKRLTECDRFPRQALAIANNGEGDQLLFLRTDDRFEAAVYRWSHETCELAKVAEDFGQLERR